MRSIIAIALSISSVLALRNADFNPVNFAAAAADEAAPVKLTEKFANFRWRGDKAFAKEAFSIDSKDNVRIQVTDYMNRGDQFEIFANGESLGLTSKVDSVKDDEVFAEKPELALLDDRFSKGVFNLPAGTHEITIKAVGPYNAGTAAIRLLEHDNVAFHKKGGHHDDEEDDDEEDWHHDDDDDEEEHGHHGGHHGGQGGHHGGQGGHQGGHHGGQGGHHGGEGEHHGKQWKYKTPTNEEIDLDHTVTYTKTKWVYHKPTYISAV